MKNKHFPKVLFTSISFFALTACTDLVVPEKDSSVRASSGDATFTPGNPTELLASAYVDLGTYTDQAGIYALGEHTSAEMIPPTRGVDWGDNGVWRTLDAHTWDASHTYIRDAWNNLNQRVYKTNEIIASSPSASQLAQAKFLRAFNMYHVMDYFGQVPFREVTQGVNEFPKILSRSEAFDFIVKDLEEALPGLSDLKPNVTPGVASKAAANALLAKLYLNKAVFKSSTPAGPYTFDKADMDKVIAYANAVTASGYALESSYFKNFANAGSSEVIFVSNEGTAQNRWFMTLHYNQNPSGWNGFTTLADFYDKFETGDQRKGSPALGNGKEFSGIGRGFLIGTQIDDSGKPIVDTRTQKVLSFTRDVPLAGAATDKGIRVIKYHPSDAGKYILTRLGEVVLAKAEALFRSGNAASALTLVNELRTARGAKALTSLTEQALFDEIGRETYWEGGARTYEIRFGKFLTGTGAEKKDAHLVLFPIPSSAIVSNPNLKQNAGY
ncbi:RagB/SusD family nutrient uptake outer membrane protein [Flectobacillus major]|uniref:RagB/SusD family nutrient uptake outer membrane protein n=1 Tax=Flectobacillus major TaxID=103 RepID=UPI0003FE4766|nr:RagB/SusD family nutrient uptake outer membrane protein [Flectobacillus major]